MPDYPAPVRRVAAFSVMSGADPSFRYDISLASTKQRTRFLHRGLCGDGHIARGWKAFKQWQWDDPAHKAAAQRLSKKSFRRLALRWLLHDPNCLYDFETQRNNPDGCTQKQLERAAQILGTPYRPDGTVHYWTSVQECIDGAPRGAELQALQRKSGKPPDAFGKLLLARCADLLAFTAADRRGEMTESTAAERQLAADVWACRIPWLVVSGPGQRRRYDPAKDRIDSPPPGSHYVYFQHGKVIQSHMTFMLDATIMINQSGADKKRVNAFKSKKIAHPPELVRAGKSVGTESKVMAYLVIHPHLGLVSGPDIMHHATTATAVSEGRRKPREERRKPPERHHPDFPTW